MQDLARAREFVSGWFQKMLESAMSGSATAINQVSQKTRNIRTWTHWDLRPGMQCHHNTRPRLDALPRWIHCADRPRLIHCIGPATHNYPSTCGLVAMTSASHAEGRQLDPGQVYECCHIWNCSVMDSWHHPPPWRSWLGYAALTAQLNDRDRCVPGGIAPQSGKSVPTILRQTLRRGQEP